MGTIKQQGVAQIFFNWGSQADKSGDLDAVEVFKLEHYAAVVRREYLESYEKRTPPAVTRAQMKAALSDRGDAFSSFTPHRFTMLPSCFYPSLYSCLCHADFALDDETFRTLWNEHQSRGGINYDEFVAVLTKLQILRGQQSKNTTLSSG